LTIIKLQGGLGNQMFQYAAAKSIAKESVVYFDISFFISNQESTDTFTARQFELSIFKNLRGHILSSYKSDILNSNNLINKFLKRAFFRDVNYIHQSEKNENIDLDNITNSTVYLDGYFQNENYFKAIRKQLLNDFSFPQPSDSNKNIEYEIKTADNTVGVHIRRGDYIKPHINNYHGLLPLSYYQQATKEIEKRIVNPRYFIFSDDPDWCKTAFTFLGDTYQIVSRPITNSWEDMYLMSLCKHNIIANSSYSWWGAWLNNNKDKIVIAPRNWFVAHDPGIVPSQWIKI